MTDLSKELLTRADLIFGKIADAASNAGTLAMDQLPDIATQFILYSRVFYTAQLLVGPLLIGLAVWLYKIGFKKLNSRTKIYSDDGFRFFMAGTPVAIMGIVVSAVAFNAFCMVWFAPKIFLIREIMKLVKG